MLQTLYFGSLKQHKTKNQHMGHTAVLHIFSIVVNLFLNNQVPVNTKQTQAKFIFCFRV